MNVAGEFDALRGKVFKVLRDAHSFVRFVDDVRDLEQIDSYRYQAVFETEVGCNQVCSGGPSHSPSRFTAQRLRAAIAPFDNGNG